MSASDYEVIVREPAYWVEKKTFTFAILNLLTSTVAEGICVLPLFTLVQPSVICGAPGPRTTGLSRPPPK